MKATFILFILFLCMTSCVDTEKENDRDNYPNQNIYENDNQNIDHEIDSDSQNTTTETNEESEQKNEIEPKKAESSIISNGTYINTSHLADNSCRCYCLEVTDGSSELCLKENDLYISARFVQKGENIEIFYTGKSSRTTNEDIPWGKFETGTPIAVLMPNANNTFNLDWKGFTVDGDIAVDYALLGKKTLEGTYKKK